MVLCLSSMFCGPAGAARAAAAAVAVPLLPLPLPPILALTAEPLLVTPPPLRLAPSMLSLQVSGAASFVSFDWHLSHTITPRLQRQVYAFVPRCLMLFVDGVFEKLNILMSSCGTDNCCSSSTAEQRLMPNGKSCGSISHSATVQPCRQNQSPRQRLRRTLWVRLLLAAQPDQKGNSRKVAAPMLLQHLVLLAKPPARAQSLLPPLARRLPRSMCMWPFLPSTLQ
jgi:hypothetical protein